METIIDFLKFLVGITIKIILILIITIIIVYFLACFINWELIQTPTIDIIDMIDMPLVRVGIIIYFILGIHLYIHYGDR
tara:strand:- start:36659 stop:36895 length:237 start_codon:yes stop_codon:yes gene_type:complete